MAIDFDISTQDTIIDDVRVLPFACPKVGKVDIKTTDIYL